MKYAFVSDIHGNLQAWTQVWASLAAEKVDGVICLGDIIGYGPRPAETLASVRSKVNFCVIGNHDAVIAGLEDPSRFNAEAQNLIHWSAEKMDDDAIKYFSELPYELNLDTEHEIIRCVHGSTYEPEMFWYVSNANEARLAWNSTDAQITFIGHSHVPGYFTLSPDNEVKYREGNNLLYQIEEGTRYIINAGSVGLSRDGDRRAAYCIYDSENRNFYWRRVDFDLEEYRRDVKYNMPDKTMAAFVLDNFELSVETQAIKKFTDFQPSDETQRLTINRKATIQTINVSKNSIRRRKTGSTQNIQPMKKDKRPNTSKTKLIVFLISAIVLTIIVALIFTIGNIKNPRQENDVKISIPEEKHTKLKVPKKPVVIPPPPEEPIKPTKPKPNASSLSNSILDAMNQKPTQKTVQTNKGNNDIINDNFNSEKPGEKPKGYYVNPAGGPIEIAAIPSSSNKSIMIKDESSTKNSGFTKGLKKSQGLISIHFKIRAEQKGQPLSIAVVDDTGKIKGLQIQLTKVGIGYWDGKNTHAYKNYETGKFMAFSISANTKTKRFSLFMNNKPVFENKPFINNIPSLGRLRFTTETKSIGTFYIDDIKVYKQK